MAGPRCVRWAHPIHLASPGHSLLPHLEANRDSHSCTRGFMQHALGRQGGLHDVSQVGTQTGICRQTLYVTQ